MGELAYVSVEQRLLAALADGLVRSAGELSAHSGIARATVPERMQWLRGYGWPIEGDRERGYYLGRGSRPLEAAVIAGAMAGRIDLVCSTALYTVVSSTQSVRVGAPGLAGKTTAVCVAEHQTAGRGRRGDPWQAPLGAGITLSLARYMERRPLAIGLLAPAIGIAVARMLTQLGIAEVGLKWPNDVVISDDKLAGILVEMRLNADSAATLVVGLGLNYDIDRARVGANATDVVSHTAAPPSRSHLVGALTVAVDEAVTRLQHDPVAEPIARAWAAYDAYAARPARVVEPSGSVEGIARGIDDTGALVLELASGRHHRCVRGSLRPMSLRR
jgi:BirA family biotin operon repressor/biotin-[acetyl-CoA-carboxylase] ligase